jgi:hypothetical protein
VNRKRSLLWASLIGIVGSLFIPALARADGYTFQTIGNNADAAFNQLLSINNAGIIAGYYGDGFTVPNHGFSVTPPYAQGNFINENFPGAVQTQVTGINNQGTTVGFYADAAGNNFGFSNQAGVFTTVSTLNTPNQLLGVNDHNYAVGFYTDSAGNSHAYVYNLLTMQSFSLTLPDAIQSVATGMDNAGGDVSGDISGFLQLANGNTVGFYHNRAEKGSLEFEVPGSTNTMFLGLNNNGLVVGSYVDANGVTHGLVYNTITNTYQTVDDPLASANPASDVTGTTINGINDQGQLVGFYSDGTNVNGFLATPSVAPEPASLWLFATSALLGLAVSKKARLRKDRQA